MIYFYRLAECTVYDEDGSAYRAYGIEARDAVDNIWKSYPDLFFDRKPAEELVLACNEGELDIVHLEDVIEDALP